MRQIQLYSVAALVAMAALSLSCSKTDAVDASVAPHPVSFELGLGEPGTKMSMTAEADGIKSAWEVDDEISVFWATADETATDQYETFKVTAVSADGKSATFSNASSTMPNDCTLGIYYPAKPHGGDGWKSWPYTYATNGGGTGLSIDNAKLSNAGKWALYGKSGVTVTGGVISAASLEQKSSFLLIKAGTVISGLSTDAYYSYNIELTGLPYLFRANTTEQTTYTYKNETLTGLQVTTADTIPFDIYIPFVPNGSDETVVLKVQQIDTDGSPSSYVYTKDLGTKALQPGKVYDISAKLHNVASD